MFSASGAEVAEASALLSDLPGEGREPTAASMGLLAGARGLDHSQGDLSGTQSLGDKRHPDLAECLRIPFLSDC